MIYFSEIFKRVVEITDKNFQLSVNLYIRVRRSFVTNPTSANKTANNLERASLSSMCRRNVNPRSPEKKIWILNLSLDWKYADKMWMCAPSRGILPSAYIHGVSRKNRQISRMYFLLLEFILKKSHIYYNSIRLNYWDIDSFINIDRQKIPFITFIRFIRWVLLFYNFIRQILFFNHIICSKCLSSACCSLLQSMVQEVL